MKTLLMSVLAIITMLLNSQFAMAQPEVAFLCHGIYEEQQVQIQVVKTTDKDALGIYTTSHFGVQLDILTLTRSISGVASNTIYRSSNYELSIAEDSFSAKLISLHDSAWILVCTRRS